VAAKAVTTDPKPSTAKAVAGGTRNDTLQLLRGTASAFEEVKAFSGKQQARTLLCEDEMPPSCS
jgi:hypothetical protein